MHIPASAFYNGSVGSKQCYTDEEGSLPIGGRLDGGGGLVQAEGHEVRWGGAVLGVLFVGRAGCLPLATVLTASES